MELKFEIIGCRIRKRILSMILLKSWEFVNWDWWVFYHRIFTHWPFCSYLMFTSIHLRATMTLLVMWMVVMASVINEHSEGVDFWIVIDLHLAFITSTIPIDQQYITIGDYLYVLFLGCMMHARLGQLKFQIYHIGEVVGLCYFLLRLP